jgi:uncharacterized protein
MSHTPHELAEEFPQSLDMIARLKGEDSHFARLTQMYHDINRAIHRAETLVEPVAQHAETEMRRTRLSLKDQIGRMLADAAQPSCGCSCGDGGSCCS